MAGDDSYNPNFGQGNRAENRTNSADDRKLSDGTKFSEIQAEVDELDIEQLLDDPEYLDFLDSFGELELGDGDGNDEFSLDDLVELEPDKQRDEVIASNEETTASQTSQGSALEAADVIVSILQRAELTDDQQHAIREAIGMSHPNRVEVQMNHHKSRFFDLEAYIQSIEELFDEDRDVLSELDQLYSELKNVRQIVNRLEEHRETTNGQFNQLTTDYHSHDRALSKLQTSMGSLEQEVEQDLAEISSELNEAREWRRRVAQAADPNQED